MNENAEIKSLLEKILAVQIMNNAELKALKVAIKQEPGRTDVTDHIKNALFQLEKEQKRIIEAITPKRSPQIR